MNVRNPQEKVSFADLLNESLFGRDSIEGRVVVGTIVEIKNDKVVIDVGLKAEGRLFLNDVKTLKGSDSVAVGETLQVFVERFEDRNGEPVLSIEKAKREAVWSKLESLLESGESIEGIITGRTKGGYAVDIDGTTAFLPGSQVDLRLVKDITPLLNLKQPFKILKMDKQRNNIVVSRRAVLETVRNEAKSEIMSRLEEGMTLSGVVKNITDYGVFVDIGGIDGLLHVTDMSWKRVSLPSDLVKVGDTLNVQIIKFNRESGRISLGMKQLMKTPWEGIEQRYIIGNKYKGKIVNVTDYGAFVELEDCIEGMIYITELSWVRKNIHPSKLVTIGEEIEVIVLDVNPQKRKISLGLKQCQENPWKQFEETHPAGTKIEGIIKNITEFGIFVGVNDVLDGMVHVSDVSWHSGTKDDKSKDIQKGQKIEVIVLDVNPEKERINLGIKQLEDDPYAELTKMIDRKGDGVFVTVKEIHQAGVDVELEDGLPGFIKKGDISSDKNRQRSDAMRVGEKVEAMILGIDRGAKVVNLTIRGLEIKREKEAVEQFGTTDKEGASLGDILGLALKEKDDSEAS
ncbi:MAG: 30S ribosomal protein S1 [Holosporales bacterium]|jgi:small subunit ribosomal protein S1|nr:30S ribosomal protein S1 [Holosporales bacterium]